MKTNEIFEQSNLGKKYYNLCEIALIHNLTYRYLLKRVKVIFIQYGNSELIYKKSNRWYIHASLISKFSRTKFPIDYKLFITIASKSNYEVKYWKSAIYELNNSLKVIEPKVRTKYVVEKTKKGRYHLHIMTSFGGVRKLRRAIADHNIFTRSNDMNIKIQYITDVKNLHKYFQKEHKPVLISP